MTSYLHHAPADAATLVAQGAIDDFTATMLAVAPDGRTWASASASGARLYDGDRERAAARIDPPEAATAIAFSADGAALHVGLRAIDAATGAASPPRAIDGLAAWAAAAGQPAPPTLSTGAARLSADGTLLVIAATGMTRDRRTGQRRPETGDVDWVIALDGATRKPTDVLWHGRGVHSVFAISADHVAAAGQAPAKVFARKALTRAIALGGSAPGTTALVWSPGGELLAATAGKQVAVWRTGSWDQPAASWEIGGDHQSAVAFHPGRPVLAVGNRDGHLRLYGVADAELAHPPLILDHDAGGPIRALAFSPDGATLRAIVRSSKNEILRFAVTLAP